MREKHQIQSSGMAGFSHSYRGFFVEFDAVDTERFLGGGSLLLNGEVPLIRYWMMANKLQ